MYIGQLVHMQSKTEFSTVTVSDKCRCTLAEPDSWTRGWVSQGNSHDLEDNWNGCSNVLS